MSRSDFLLAPFVRPRSRTLPLASLVGVGAFAAIVAILPVLKDGYDPVRQAISDGAIGDLGWLQAVAFFGLGLGSLTLAWIVGGRLKGRPAKVGATLLGLWGFGILLAGIFRTDPTGGPETTAGTIHVAASLLSFLFVLTGAIILSFAFRRHADWRRHFPLSIALAVAAAVAFVAVAVSEGSNFWGLMQRIFIGLVVAWLLTTAARARSGGSAAPAPKPQE